MSNVIYVNINAVTDIIREKIYSFLKKKIDIKRIVNNTKSKHNNHKKAKQNNDMRLKTIYEDEVFNTHDYYFEDDVYNIKDKQIDEDCEWGWFVILDDLHIK